MKRGGDADNLLFQLSGILAEQAEKIESMAKRQAPAPKSDSIEDIIARASKLQRSLKRPGPADSDYGSNSFSSSSSSSSRRSRRRQKTGPATVDDFVAITVCEMKIKHAGGYQRCKDHQLEITTARRSDSYDSFALKAASALDLKPPSTIQNLCLFKATGGVRISNADIVISDTSRPWSLGSYLALLKKNPSNVQIGVCYVRDDTAGNESEYSSNDSEASAEPNGTRFENSAQLEGPRLESSPAKSVIISSDNSDDNSQSNTGMSLPRYNVDPWVSKGTLAVGVQRFDEQTLVKATDNFSDDTKLGEGGFGVVHRGLLFGSHVAIKRLSLAGTRAIARQETDAESTLLDQLYTEISALSRCRHKNLVELMGFCLKPPILVYELMERGNLYSLLHKETPPLTWQQRCHCMRDVCRGLVWLHNATPPMRHGDLKASNILVDRNFNTKIGDFGFTQEMPICLSNTVALKTANQVVKSVGYSAPELDLYRHSVKTDVYSYGVLVLETYTGLPPFDKEEEDILLTERVQQNLVNLNVFQEIACGRIEPPSESITHVFLLITTSTLQKHSLRPQSDKVMKIWDSLDI